MRPQGDERGAAAVELALVASLLIVLVLGIMDIGRALFAQVALQDAVQEGAVYASYYPDDDGKVRARVVDSADWPPLTTSDVDVTCPLGADGGRVEVTATYELELITPLGAWWGGSMTLSSANRGRIYSEEPCDAST